MHSLFPTCKTNKRLCLNRLSRALLHAEFAATFLGECACVCVGTPVDAPMRNFMRCPSLILI
jgi:hypothetical protein